MVNIRNYGFESLNLETELRKIQNYLECCEFSGADAKERQRIKRIAKNVLA